MNILIISNGADNGGVGIAIKQAFDRHTDWNVRFVRRANNFINYDADIEWRPGDGATGAVVSELFEHADVVHVMEKFPVIEQFAGWESKPWIMHHHGGVFRSNPTAFVSRCKELGVIQIGAIFDILKLAPDDVEWLPNPVNIPMMLRYRAANYNLSPRLRITQSPTGHGSNHTRQFLEATAGLGADVSLIERMPWHDHLRVKARADIVFDSLTTGYGITLTEGWGMNIMGVAGADDPDALELMRSTIGYVPYYEVTEQTFAERMAALVESNELQRTYTALGWQCVNDFHDERKVVEQLKGIYERAVG